MPDAISDGAAADDDQPPREFNYWVDVGGKFCSATVLAICHLSMGHSQSGDGARLGQGFPTVPCGGGNRRMRGMVAQMLKVGAGV